MSLAAIRAGIGKNLATIPGLRVATEVPDNPSPPIAILHLNSVSYDADFQRGMTRYDFTVTVIAGRVAERDGQRKLDAYIDNGERSIKTALESDGTLDAAAFDCRVSELSAIGVLNLGEQQYLSCDFLLQVYGK